VSDGGRDVVVQAAMAAAGPHANDVQSRCSWDCYACTAKRDTEVRD
jgi:hypothetical protein